MNVIPFPSRKDRLSDADEALVTHLQDAHAGMAWWNSLHPADRLHWLNVAGSAAPGDAWEAFKAGNPPSEVALLHPF